MNNFSITYCLNKHNAITRIKTISISSYCRQTCLATGEFSELRKALEPDSHCYFLVKLWKLLVNYPHLLYSTGGLFCIFQHLCLNSFSLCL